MTSAEIIGKVAALYLKSALSGEENSDGTARFIVDNLSAQQTAAVATAILEDANLASLVEIKLPAHFLNGFGLPPEVLTHQRATQHRNEDCAKPALLLANTGDDEAQSLNLVSPIGAPQLSDNPALWVRIAATDLALDDTMRLWWEKALAGLLELNIRSISQIAEYALQTRRAIDEAGLPILLALGHALPALAMPRDTNYFNALNDKFRGHASRWKNLYSSANKKRACFLNKQTASQTLLSADDLNRAFEKVKDVIPAVHHPVVQAFIESPSGWNDHAFALACCEWEEVNMLFDGLKRERLNLGEATHKFYDEYGPELVNDADNDYLKRLAARKTTQSDDEDRAFYEAHRTELKEDRKLKSHWDKFIFSAPRESEDFLAGLISCLESLFSQGAPSKKRKLNIRCDHRTKRDFKELNVEAGTFFNMRYKGLRNLFGSRVTWEVGKLWEYTELVEEWRSSRTRLNDSSARAALQLKFVLELECELVTGGSESYTAQLLWKYNPQNVASELRGDLRKLTARHPLLLGRAKREMTSSKGRFQSIDLSNVRTLDTVNGSRGSFVSAYRKENDIGVRWQENLEKAKADELLAEHTASDLNEKFTRFQESYKVALKAFYEEALAKNTLEALLDQAKTYAELLESLCRDAKGDRNRDLLLRPLLQIGAISVAGGTRPAVIVTPWHPLRLAAIASKARLVAGLLNHLLTTEVIEFGDSRLYFKELHEALAHPFYPEVTLGWNGDKAELLTLSDATSDYTLHEPPVVGPDDDDDTGENPTQAAQRVAELVDRYLVLHPHESANLSVVLYNCDSARLPQAVVDRIGSMYEDDEYVRCQVILRHRDGRRLRTLYERIIESSDGDDAYSASEATRDFMARLRIGIMADQAAVPDPKDGCPADISFSQDVIARHARLEWYTEESEPIEMSQLIPSQWSRRRPAARDDMKSIVYGCCPAQSPEGWSYLTAVTTFLRGDWDSNRDQRLLPARQLDFQDPQMQSIFQETHNLANWVVNYDELLDRRQLMNQQVRIIRYKQSSTQGRNLIISSGASTGLLESMLFNRLRDLGLSLSNDELRELTRRFIDEASDISGDIVLRAAKRGRSASELIGVVLSRFLIRHELGTDRHFGWYFLDDYASWLGQREEQIADILALSPIVGTNGQLRLAVVIAESKYIAYDNLNVKSKESQKQLRDTVKRMSDALFGAPQRLDRSLWLARLSDLILDGVQFPASAGINLGNWRRAMREGTCEIYLRGYSHVYVSGPSNAPPCADFLAVPEMNNSYQEIFGRSQLRELMLKYWHNEDPITIRQATANADIWNNQTYQRPSGLVPIVVPRRSNSDVEPGARVSKGVVADLISDPLDSSNTGTPNVNEPVDGSESMPTASNDSSERQSNPHDKSTHNSQVGLEVIITTQDNEPSARIGNDSDISNTNPQYSHWAYPAIGQVIHRAAQGIKNNEVDAEWLKDVESRTRAALQGFGLQAKLIESKLTPNAALLKFQGSANLTVEQVLRKQTEFKTTYGLTIVSIQPEPGVVSIAVERLHRRIVRVEDLWARWNPSCENGNQELLVATREDDGGLLFLSPSKEHAPHTLIAGSTGSGKSVLMQNIILGIAATNTPAQAEIILIDPKYGVDYFIFESLPHIRGGIIVSQETALERLEALVQIMEDRSRRFRENRAANLTAYNRKVSESERLPTIWVIHDEFATWMLIDEYKNAVSAIVGRLAVQARAAGIYLVFAAQRPDANVMPMQLRANLGNRLILRVDSEGTSEIALAAKGAERLLGKGHLIARLEGETSLIYAQVPFISESMMETLVEIIGAK